MTRCSGGKHLLLAAECSPCGFSLRCARHRQLTNVSLSLRCTRGEVCSSPSWREPVGVADPTRGRAQRPRVELHDHYSVIDIRRKGMEALASSCLRAEVSDYGDTGRPGRCRRGTVIRQASTRAGAERAHETDLLASNDGDVCWLPVSNPPRATWRARLEGHSV